jgi:transposase
MVLEHWGDYPSRWSTALSVAEKVSVARSTLHEWVKKAEVDPGICGEFCS